MNQSQLEEIIIFLRRFSVLVKSGRLLDQKKKTNQSRPLNRSISLFLSLKPKSHSAHKAAPPPIVSTCPFIQAPSWLHRKATTRETSSGIPTRRRGDQDAANWDTQHQHKAGVKTELTEWREKQHTLSTCSSVIDAPFGM